MTNNRISLTITDAQKSDINKKTGDLTAATSSFKTVVSREELKSMSKLGDARIPFVEKIAQYAASNPEFLQPFADVAEFNQDLKVFTDIREVVRPLRQIVDNLESSMMVSGSEAYDFARNYYKAVQFQAKMGVPGAQTIYDDLRPLFESKPAPPAPKP